MTSPSGPAPGGQEAMMKIPEKTLRQHTENLKALLEKGVLPFKQQFLQVALAHHGFGNPSGYRGGNAIQVAMEAAKNGYASRTWLTFAKFVELRRSNPGMRMRKGSKSVSVLRPVKVYEKDANGDTVLDINGNPVVDYITYNSVDVFNGDCFEGYAFKDDTVDDSRLNRAIIGDCAKAEAGILAMYPDAPTVLHDVTGKAFYRPSEDAVHMPPYEEFSGVSEFISVLCHELAHSTGAKFRLNRKAEYADTTELERYGFEELVAECTASLMCIHLGITDTIENSAAYLEGWSKSLTDNTDWLFKAMGFAEKAFARMTAAVADTAAAA